MLKELEEIRAYVRRGPGDSSMGDHLVTVFEEALELKPRLIVEAGVWHGQSTFALAKAASLTKATFISIDVTDYSSVCSYQGWLFVQANDLEFAERFEGFCGEHQIKPEIDILFIDALHTYEHVSKEIAAWFPFLSRHAKAMFHDTNATEIVFRKDGTQRVRPDITETDLKRCIIRALEDYFGRDFNEEIEFEVEVGDWRIKHYPYTHGLTICEQNKPPAKEKELC